MNSRSHFELGKLQLSSQLLSPSIVKNVYPLHSLVVSETILDANNCTIMYGYLM